MWFSHEPQPQTSEKKKKQKKKNNERVQTVLTDGSTQSREVKLIIYHPALLLLSFPSFYLSANPPSGATYHSLLTCPASAALSLDVYGTSFPYLPPSLTHSSFAKPVDEPHSSLSLSICTVSKSLRGISDSLANCPLLHLKAGWPNFSSTLLQLSPNQHLLKHWLA